MYKLWHRLFGWDYVLVNMQYRYDEIVRVHTPVKGVAYVVLKGNVVTLDKVDHSRVTPLTFTWKDFAKAEEARDESSI